MKGNYTVVMAKRKASGNGYDFKHKGYRYMARAIDFTLEHWNEYDNIYLIDEHDGHRILEKCMVTA